MLVGLFLATFAGASTGIGAAFVFIIKRPSQKLLSISLGFSAGVMIAVSIFELLPGAIFIVGLTEAGFCFMLGVIIMALLDFFIPHEYEYEGQFCYDEDNVWEEVGKEKINDLLRTGKLVAIGIAIHNFPEGLITMTSSLQSVSLGLLIAVAITLHNIPEGLSIAIPIYGATGNRNKAFKISFLSGFAEPLGAIIGYVILSPFLNETMILDYLIAATAGIMTFISIDELLPGAYATCNGNTHPITIGIILGMIIMLITIIIL